MTLQDIMDEALSIFYKPSKSFLYYYRYQKQVQRWLMGVSMLACFVLALALFLWSPFLLLAATMVWLMAALAHYLKTILIKGNVERLKQCREYIKNNSGVDVKEEQLVDTGVLVYLRNLSVNGRS